MSASDPGRIVCPLSDEELKAVSRAALSALLPYISPRQLDAHPPSILNLKVRNAITRALSPEEE